MCDHIREKHDVDLTDVETILMANVGEEMLGKLMPPGELVMKRQRASLDLNPADRREEPSPSMAKPPVR